VDAPATQETDRFINRELSLLEFNWRVLEQAGDKEIPLLDRLRFLCISVTNLDEFFEVRVAALKQRLESGAPAPGPDNLTPQELLTQVRQHSLELVRHQYETLNNILFPELSAEQIRFLQRADWTAEQKKWLSAFFQNEVVPVLTPITLDPSRPFPRILNKSLNFIVSVNGKDAYGRSRHRAIVQAPRSLPRVIRLPDKICEIGSDNFVFLSSIIHENVADLFPGLTLDGCYQFRVTRNSNLYVDDEEVEETADA
jgi:polyphosphate kinase